MTSLDHVVDHKRSLAHLAACVPAGYDHKKNTQVTDKTWWTEQNNWVVPTQLIPAAYWKEFENISGSDQIRVSDRGGGGDCMFRVLADALNIRFHTITFDYGDIREIIAAQVKTQEIAKWLMDVYIFTEKNVKFSFDDEMQWRPSQFVRDSALHKWTMKDQMNELKNVIRTTGQMFWGDAFMLILLLDTHQCFLRYSIDCYVLSPSFEPDEHRIEIFQIPTRDSKPRESVLFILFTGSHYELIGTVRSQPKQHIETILNRKELLPIHQEWIRQSTYVLSNTQMPQPLSVLFQLLLQK